MRRGLTIVVGGPEPHRLRAALGLAAAEAALGGRVRLHFDHDAVPLLAALADEHRALAEAAIDLGATVSYCQAGLAAAGIAADAVARCEASGLIALLGDLGDDRLVIA